jgi:hypothetical protein
LPIPPPPLPPRHSTTPLSPHHYHYTTRGREGVEREKYRDRHQRQQSKQSGETFDGDSNFKYGPLKKIKKLTYFVSDEKRYKIDEKFLKSQNKKRFFFFLNKLQGFLSTSLYRFSS